MPRPRDGAAGGRRAPGPPSTCAGHGTGGVFQLLVAPSGQAHGLLGWAPIHLAHLDCAPAPRPAQSAELRRALVGEGTRRCGQQHLARGRRLAGGSCRQASAWRLSRPRRAGGAQVHCVGGSFRVARVGIQRWCAISVGNGAGARSPAPKQALTFDSRWKHPHLAGPRAACTRAGAGISAISVSSPPSGHALANPIERAAARRQAGVAPFAYGPGSADGFDWTAAGGPIARPRPVASKRSTHCPPSTFTGRVRPAARHVMACRSSGRPSGCCWTWPDGSSRAGSAPAPAPTP